MIAQKDIHYCIGREICQNNGGTCVFKDDMLEILTKMGEADVIVLATPICYYTMNGQIKTLIDRKRALSLDRVHGKKVKWKILRQWSRRINTEKTYRYETKRR